MLLALTLIPGLEPNDVLSIGRALSIDDTITCKFGIDKYLIYTLNSHLHLIHHRLRFMQAASWRGLYIHEDGSHIFFGHQSRLGGFHQQKQTYTSQYRKNNAQPTTFHEKEHTHLIFVDQLMESRIECDMEP